MVISRLVKTSLRREEHQSLLCLTFKQSTRQLVSPSAGGNGCDSPYVTDASVSANTYRRKKFETYWTISYVTSCKKNVSLRIERVCMHCHACCLIHTLKNCNFAWKMQKATLLSRSLGARGRLALAIEKSERFHSSYSNSRLIWLVCRRLVSTCSDELVKSACPLLLCYDRIVFLSLKYSIEFLLHGATGF